MRHGEALRAHLAKLAAAHRRQREIIRQASNAEAERRAAAEAQASTSQEEAPK